MPRRHATDELPARRLLPRQRANDWDGRLLPGGHLWSRHLFVDVRLQRELFRRLLLSDRIIERHAKPLRCGQLLSGGLGLSDAMRRRDLWIDDHAQREYVHWAVQRRILLSCGLDVGDWGRLVLVRILLPSGNFGGDGCRSLHCRLLLSDRIIERHAKPLRCGQLLSGGLGLSDAMRRRDLWIDDHAQREYVHWAVQRRILLSGGLDVGDGSWPVLRRPLLSGRVDHGRGSRCLFRRLLLPRRIDDSHCHRLPNRKLLPRGFGRPDQLSGWHLRHSHRADHGRL